MQIIKSWLSATFIMKLGPLYQMKYNLLSVYFVQTLYIPDRLGNLVELPWTLA